MSNVVPLQQIVQSAQVWVCDACGCQDNKSCSCNSPAHMEKLADKREATRKRNIALRDRKKTNENNDDVTRHADVENTKESHQAPGKAHRVVGPKDEPLFSSSQEQAAERNAEALLARAPDLAKEIALFTDDQWWPWIEKLRKIYPTNFTLGEDWPSNPSISAIARG